jgi:hypothetical protein
MGSLNAALGTPKNPQRVLSPPWTEKVEGQNRRTGQATKPNTSGNLFVDANYNILLEAVDLNGTNGPELKSVGDANMRRYLGAGFALSDIYCEGFFRKVDEAQRRRRYGRSLTNDIGGAFTTVLGLANAAKDTITGAAALFSVGDGAWRNYDEAFSLGPDLSTIKTLSMAAQDNFRARTLQSDQKLPADYGTAQSVILKYANLCSALGVKALLDTSAKQEVKKLDDETDPLKKDPGKPPATVTAPADNGPAATRQPTLAPNTPAPGT